MSESILNQAADLRGPVRRTTGDAEQNQNRIIVLSEDGTAHNRDLSSGSFFNSTRYMEGYVDISCEAAGSPVAFFWYWSDSNSATIDKTATGNGATTGAFCPSGIIKSERPQGQYLVIQTAAAANVHIWISSGKF